MDMFRLLIGPDEGADTLQLCFRALILFLFGIACVRIAGRRTFAHYSPLDIVVALIVGSNISRVMTGKAAFFPALAATLVLVVLHRLLAYATLHWGILSWLVKARPIRIVEDGQLDEARLRRAEMSREDLLEALRMEQVDSIAAAAQATLEAGGKLSVVPKPADDRGGGGSA
ncbi:MAG TPA: YetF domain-containing protein [Sphingomonadaceae bacterium]|nr:YetF domain-containing protein [Sphingomonadaceae bacterium]